MTMIYEDGSMRWTGWVLQADQLVTRRKRFHFLTSPEGQVKQVFRSITPMIEKITALEVKSVLIINDNSLYIAEFRQLPSWACKKDIRVMALEGQKELPHHG